MQKLFKFESNKTYFGLDIHRLGVKVSDIETMPFLDQLICSMMMRATYIYTIGKISVMASF